MDQVCIKQLDEQIFESFDLISDLRSSVTAATEDGTHKKSDLTIIWKFEANSVNLFLNPISLYET